MPVAVDDIPPLESVFDLKSAARAKLVDRCGSMVMIEVEIGSNGARSKQGSRQSKVTSVVNIERVTSGMTLLETSL